MKKFSFILAAIYLACGQFAFADEFAKLKCGADIPKALIGQRSTNGPVVDAEKKYAALGLKNKGGDEISDRLNSVNWTICGVEYMMLIERRGSITDVVPFPEHSKQVPAFTGLCQSKGKEKNLPDIFAGVLDGASKADMLPAVTLWKIDKQRGKFIKVSTEGLLCPRSGIYTVDGGL